MGRQKQDTELRAITACVGALQKLDEGQQARAMSYLGDRFTPQPLTLNYSWEEVPATMLHDDDSDEDERSPWPHELGDLGPLEDDDDQADS